MAPQDDLTAERADFDELAVRIFNRLTVHKHDEMKHDYRANERLIADGLKTAREEALRERRQTISKLFDENTSGTPEYYCALLDAGNALDRLASEGTPAPIDLFPKLKDDGGYGEHF